MEDGRYRFCYQLQSILQAIDDLLVKDPTSSIQVELYKLNVYGSESFFKAHVDTPRSEKVFGSLVVVLPTRHEGGDLLLRHRGREWTFNSADIISPQIRPHAFISFFSDVEHEVSVVKSGYRVTLTYNLYFGDDKSTNVPSMLHIDDTEVKIKKSLIALLNDETFPPEGGLLDFSLSSIEPQTTKLPLLGNNLKGTDAAIKRASLYISEDPEGVAGLLNEVADLGTCEIEGDILLHLAQQYSTTLVYEDATSLEDLCDSVFCNGDYSDVARRIVWLKPLTNGYSIEAPYVAYGNEATLAYAYGEFCLVMEVEASEDR